MTLRTPHRRISPRTKRRYRAIRNFLRRALGNTSQQSIKINSSIAVNITDLNHKVVSLERQLSEVSRHFNECQASKKTTESEVSTERRETEIKSHASGLSLDSDALDIETRYINKDAYNTQTYTNREESKYEIQEAKNCLKNKNMSYNTSSKSNKKKSKLNFESHHQDFESKYERFHKNRSESKDNCLLHSTTTCHSLISSNRGENNYYYSHYFDKKHSKHRKKYAVKSRDDYVNRINRNELSGSPNHKDNDKNAKRSKHKHSGIDQDFIADIIKRQYGPVKYFGRRESDISQFSAPVCRDQEFAFKDFIQEGTDLCSCFHKRERRNKQNCNNIQLEDMRSVCDTRLYSSKNHTRHKHHRNSHEIDIYNDSELYDLVPVKEKSSPRSRRKFVEDNLMQYDHYKEVPPSPRSQRPRLNLRVQYYNGVEDYTKQSAIIRSLQRNKIQYKSEEKLSSGTELENIDFSREIRSKQPVLLQKDVQIQQDMIPFNSVQCPVLASKIQPDAHLINCDSNTIKIQSTEQCEGKTDNALSEIKDILQNFLQEIKKESATSSQCEKFDSSITTTEKNLNNLKVRDKETNSTESNSNNYRVEPLFIPPPCVPNITNPCFCPILPVCSMNHNIQNGCVFPTASFTCRNCINHKENAGIRCKKTKRTEAETSEDINNPDNETEQMIKEIYKVVSQNPDILRKSMPNSHSPITISPRAEKKILTSRSVGESIKTIKHDAKVGTPKLKLYSKSCEAISSQMMSEIEYDREERPKAGYSDTILEKLSLEATNSSDYEHSYNYTTTVEEKVKESKFAKVLKSFPFFKKKKKDIIEELSESESSTEVYKKGPHTPFRQEVTSYMLHDQEYINQHPVPPHPHYHHHGFYNPHPPGNYGCPDINGPRHSCCPSPMQTSATCTYNMYEPHTLHQHPPNIHEFHPPHYPPIPTAPPYSHSFGTHHKEMEPHVPLCLKEIEVKSIATQSDRKMTFFQKWSKKMHPPSASNQEDQLRNCSTQTSQDQNQKFSWKMLQQKNSPQRNLDPIKFSFNTQRELASGDMKLKNVMMKKLFYKRNPFSPRNLIIRTLLGKDKTSYGDPPKMYRPKLFL